MITADFHSIDQLCVKNGCKPCEVNWKPIKSSILCSNQFRAECLDRTGQTGRVKEDAIPTFF